MKDRADPLSMAIQRFPDLDRRLDRTARRLALRMPAHGEALADAKPDEAVASAEAWAKECLRLERSIVSILKVRARVPDSPKELPPSRR